MRAIRIHGVTAVAGSVAVLLLSTAWALSDRASKPIRTFGLGDVQVITVSPDLRRFATAGQSGAFLWDAVDGVVQHQLEHSWRVTTLAFSPDGLRLLTAGDDRMAHLWNVHSGEEIRSFKGHQGAILKVAFAPDGLTFVSSSSDNTARVWSLEKGEQLHQVTVPGAFIQLAEFTPDGQGLITASSARTNRVQLWDLASEAAIRSFAEPNWNVAVLALLPEDRLATAGEDLRVRIWDVKTGAWIRSLEGATLAITDLVVWTNRPNLTAVCQDGRLVTWDINRGELLHSPQGDSLSVRGAAFGPNQVMTADRDNVLRVRDITTGSALRSFEGHCASTTSGVAFSPDGRYVLSGGGEADARLWDSHDGTLIRKFRGHPGGTSVATFSSAGAHVVTSRGAPRPALELWNAETGQLERAFTWDGGWPTSGALSKDSSLLAAGDQKGMVRVWDSRTGALTQTLTGSIGWVTAVAFSPDGKCLAAGGSSFRPVVDLWRLENGQLLKEWELDAGSVRALDFSSSGDHLLAGWEDGVLRLINLSAGEFENEIYVNGFLNTARFSPDGAFVLTGEGWPLFTATLWATSTGQRIRTFSGHKWSVDAVAFNQSGTRILTGSDRVRMWSIADLLGQLSAERTSRAVTLRWGLGTLQRAAALDGRWEDVFNATSPWTISADRAGEFYRVRFADAP